MGRGSKQTLLQKEHTDGQYTYEKMLNITNHQENANQNHNEVTPHTSEWLSINQQTARSGKDVEIWERCELLVKLYTGVTTRENSMEVPQKKLKTELPMTQQFHFSVHI